MAKSITNSLQLTKLDFNVLFDISLANPVVKLTNASEYVVGADITTLSWWYVISTPSTTYMHQGSQNTPDRTGSWTTITQTNWPIVFNQIEWSGSNYIATLYVRDDAGNIYSETKEIAICRPYGLKKTDIGNFGQGKVIIETKCDRNKIAITDVGNYTYKGNVGTTITKDATLHFPLNPADGTRPAPETVTGGFSNILFDIPFSAEGYTIFTNVVVQYDFDDNISVKIKYKYKEDFAVYCNIDLCPIVCGFHQVVTDVKAGKCGDPDSRENIEKLVVLNGMIAEAIMAKMQPSCIVKPLPELIKEIEQYGGFDCSGCYVPGANGNFSTDGVNITFQQGCGITATIVSNDGNNIVMKFDAVTYDVKLTQAMIDAGFTLNVATDPDDACKKVYTIGVANTGIKANCPNVIPVHEHGTDDPPAECPNLRWPKDVYDVDDTNVIGTANKLVDVITILNNDTGLNGWRTKYGIAIIVTDCSIGFLCPSQVPIPPVHVADTSIINPGCIDKVKMFDKSPKDYNTGNLLGGFTFGLNYYVSYTIGGTKYPLGQVLTYADLLTALLNESHRDSAVITNYTAGASLPPADPRTVKVSIFDEDCNQVDSVDIWVDIPVPIIDDIIAVLPNSNTSQPTERQVEIETVTSLLGRVGKMCGLPASNTLPWQVFQWGNYIYTVESDTGMVYKMDFSNPAHPVLVTSVQLPIPVQVGSLPLALSGLPKYNTTIFSHWDVYFITDYTDGGNITYIMESVSGTIWQYNMSTDQVQAYFQDSKLIGRCPRVLLNGCLVFTMDGDRAASAGVPRGLQDNYIVFLRVSLGFSPGQISWAIPPTPDTDKAWAASYHPATGNIWVTMYSGDLLECSVGSNSVFSIDVYYAGSLGVFSTVRHLANSRIVNNNLYVSWTGMPANDGTRIVTIGNPPGPVSVINNGAHSDHYSFNPMPGKSWGILCYEGGIAKVDLNGTVLQDFARTTGSRYFNAICLLVTGGITNNSYCP